MATEAQPAAFVHEHWRSRASIRDGMELPEGPVFRAWHGLIRYVLPIAMGVIAVSTLLTP